MRLAARTDDNQTAIVKALRRAGCRVMSLAAVGNGCPDLIVLRGDPKGAHTIRLLEIKDGNKPPSRRKLTPHQIKFHQDWPVTVVTDVIEAMRAVGL